jgi:8-oxo-dGTP pyrophosphatase MutT (NUDIX family)
MAISPYVRALRVLVGTMRLQLPSVSAHVFDDAGRLLLVCQSESGEWSTPGGLIEPDERPSDAVVREAWEETGLVVSPDRIVAVYGGPEFVVRYANGDEAQFVITAFQCTQRGGVLLTTSDETSGAQFWSEVEAERLPLAPWLRSVLKDVYAGRAEASFHPASWTPEPRASAG